jgi:hypothetical protein
MSAADIARALNGRRARGGFVCHCPVASHGNGKGDRHPSLLIKDGSNALLVKCFAGCAPCDILDELRKRKLLVASSIETVIHIPVHRPTAVPRTSHLSNWLDETQQRTEAALRLWRESVPLLDTLGHHYFSEHRKLNIAARDFDHAVRWHEGISAIVALMTDAVTGQPTGVHRTFVATDGTKLSRKMLGRQGVIRLSSDEEVSEGLGLTEGLEDGLAVLLSGWRPVWVTGSAGALAWFPILIGIEALTIFADADEIGMKAARSCAARWTEAGAKVAIRPPGGVHE